MFLPNDVIVRLTGKVRYPAQKRALARLGYAYLSADNGEPLVRSDALETTPQARPSIGPRWDQLNTPLPRRRLR